LGVDEIQLDYVRFPTDGKLNDADFYFMKEDREFAKTDSTYKKRNKYDIIEKFVNDAGVICKKHDVRLTCDVFAIVSWQNDIDVRNTGQKISLMTKHISSLHPMIYASHFVRNYNHREDVWNEPYDILFKGTQLTLDNASTNCKIIPYIQAFDWQSNYKADYLYAQIQAIKDSNGHGYILWNAFNNYEKTLNWIKEKKGF